MHFLKERKNETCAIDAETLDPRLSYIDGRRATLSICSTFETGFRFANYGKMFLTNDAWYTQNNA